MSFVYAMQITNQILTFCGTRSSRGCGRGWGRGFHCCCRGQSVQSVTKVLLAASLRNIVSIGTKLQFIWKESMILNR